MNREERRERRQNDIKKAVVIVVAFLLGITLLAGVIVFAISKVITGGSETAKPEPETETQTEIETEYVAVTEEVQATVAPEEDVLGEQAAELVAAMTLEDKVAQMFVITPNALTGYSGVTEAGDTTKES